MSIAGARTRTPAEGEAAAGAGPGAKRARLHSILRGYGSVIVAYSGGVDSAFLAAAAHSVLGEKAIAITARSPSVSDEELADAIALARRSGWRHRVIDTDEINDPRYARNDLRRCFFCKTELYTRLGAIARDEGWNAVVNGANVDDLGDYRPGLDAAREHTVHSPLVEAGLTKEEIRQLSRGMDLPTWDKPAQACLASRIPYGTAVSVEALAQIARAERALRGLGLRQLRVRHHGDVARIEVPVEDLPSLLDEETRRAAVRGVREAGYLYVTLDLTGFRSGSMNEALGRAAAGRNGGGAASGRGQPAQAGPAGLREPGPRGAAPGAGPPVTGPRSACPRGRRLQTEASARR